MRGLVAFALCSCAGVSAAPAPPAPSPTPVLHPLGKPLVVYGEQMVFEARFRDIRVGNVQVAIGQPGFVDGRPAVIIRSRGKTDGVLALIGDLTWEMSTTVDLDTGEPIKSLEDAVLKFNGKTETSHNDRGAESLHTVHSAAAMLRGWQSTPGQEAHFELRIDEAEFGIKLHEAGHDVIGDRPAVRYEGMAREKFAFKLWISDDATRVPLQLQTDTKWGSVSIVLLEYTAPSV